MAKSGWYRLAMAGAMAIVFLNTWVAVRALHKLFDAQGWRAHTLEVITHTKAVEMEVRTADSMVRGFILTGNPVFEQRYQADTKIIYAELDQIQRLTADNSSQQQRLAYIRNRVAIKLASLNTGIAIRNSSSGPLDISLLAPTMSESPDGGPTVFYCISQIEAEEDRLLKNRVSQTGSAQTQVWLSFIGASLLDLFLLGTAAELLIRTLRDRHRLELSAAEIEALNHELRGFNVTLEASVEQRTRELAISNQELEAFSYSVSHDLRAPLRTIDGFSLALQEDFAEQLSDEGRDYINRVRAGVQRMGTLIDALLQLSRVTRSELNAEPVDLSQLITLVFNELLAADPDRDITLAAQPDVHVSGDARLLRIALENLLGNAFKFTAKTPAARIEFGTIQEADHTVYFIRDNGAGFDMQYVDRLFTAFQRLHGDRDFKGSGIGLATVSRIIRRHHGNIRAEGQIGKGASFYFTLAA